MNPCEHGRYGGDEIAQAGYGQIMAAPYSTCTCCTNIFFYIDSAFVGSNTSYEGYWTYIESTREDEPRFSKRWDYGSGGTYWTPKDRCMTCGGRYVSYGDSISPIIEVTEDEYKENVGVEGWQEYHG